MIEDYSERNFARADDADAYQLEIRGLDRCSCGQVVPASEMGQVYTLHSDGHGGRWLSSKKYPACRECAPRCFMCDGLLDPATLFSEELNNSQAEKDAGRSVAVLTDGGLMHAACAAAEMLFGLPVGCDELALKSKEEIAAAYTRMVVA